MSTPLPSLFVSHGAPLFAVDAGTTGPALQAWGATLPADLRGIVIMSPHWMARSPAVMTTPQPSTWHDFGGFPARVVRTAVPRTGQPGVRPGGDCCAQRPQAWPPKRTTTRPLDHGTWVPLMHMLPQANGASGAGGPAGGLRPARGVCHGRGPGGPARAGRAGHGLGQSMTHNLGEFFGGERAVAPYVTEFSRWIEDKLSTGDLDALLDYRAQAPHASRAHPSEDHFLPLFFALGAAGADARPDYLSREVMYSMLAMDAFTLH